MVKSPPIHVYNNVDVKPSSDIIPRGDFARYINVDVGSRITPGYPRMGVAYLVYIILLLESILSLCDT